MIKPGEIQKLARLCVVRDTQIEKDYVLSWILYGIAEHKKLSRSFVFKGGTALKKAYFQDYRFSEDLDFTLLDETITKNEISEWFKELFVFVREESNIPLEFTDEIMCNESVYNMYINYIGPFGGIGAHKKVKVDISRDEILEFEPKLKQLFLIYSDVAAHQLKCYTLGEILIEKMRSVLQRTQPRDLYDIWNLLVIKGLDIKFLQPYFERKVRNKGYDPTQFPEKFYSKLNSYKARWQGSLRAQINELPNFDQVVREVKKHIRTLNL